MGINTLTADKKPVCSKSKWSIFLNSVKKYKYAYIMVIPVILYYIIFCYVPMTGLVISFMDYNPTEGILGSAWVGLKHFREFFNSIYFWRIIRNTVTISLLDLLFNFPAPIILTLLINEVTNRKYKKFVQSVSYFPYFVSIVVVCGMLKSFTMSEGIITNVLVNTIGITKEPLLRNPEYFKAIYIISSIWKDVGWNSIIYIAALGSIDSQLYEACRIDGGGKFRQMIHITLPGLAPTIIVLLLLRMGQILSVGYEKIILLYSPAVYETADVISSFLYRKGLIELNWSYSTAVGLFNSLINFMFLIIANTLSKKLNDNSLW